jgi:molecular chaperone GrpE
MGEERRHGPDSPAGPDPGAAGPPPGEDGSGNREPDPASAPGPAGGHEGSESHKRRSQTEKLRGELEGVRAEAASHLDDARRLKAEFENYRKRVLREQTSLAEHASAALIERLLPVLDNFELALIAADRTKDYDALVRGVELVYGELLDVLHKEGLAKIDAEGTPFDPEWHEAVMEAESSATGEPYVADVLRTGYTLKGRVVRPSMVKVARR